MPDGDEDLKVLFPGTDVKVCGEIITVSPLKFTQWLRAAKLAQPLIEVFNRSGIMTFVRSKDDKGKDTVTYRYADDFGSRMVALLADGGEPLIDFIAFALGKPKAWLDALDGDEGINLATAIFSENANFFVRRMMPAVEQLMGGANPLGLENSSPVSSEQDTALTPSSTTPEIK